MLFWRKKKKSPAEEVMYLIVGLGNPGEKYEYTRHNVGFMVIDKMDKDLDIRVNKSKHQGMLGTGKLNGKSIALIKPLTYMNRSGDCIRAALNFYKLSPANLIVLVDDVNLPLGDIRIRERGSAGGQNGLKDIIAKLGTDEFIRVRVGIDPKPEGWKMADYVLSRFWEDDVPAMEEGISKACEAVLKIINDGPSAAMNLFNKKGGTK